MPRPRLRGLAADREFQKLWVGQTVSLIGSQVTRLALPLTAIVTLHASSVGVGVLRAAEFTPGIVVGWFIGAAVDRTRRRPLMIGANLLSALLLALVPIMSALDVLDLALLILVAAVVGLLDVVFEVAYFSFIPSLVGRQRLVEANSRLALSRSTSEAAGPALGGVLVQLLTAPIAVALDAASFAVAALSFAAMRVDEARPEAPEIPQGLRREIREGLETVLRSRILRTVVLSAATMNFFVNMFLAVFVLYLARTIGLHASTIGVVLAGFGVGAVAGAAATGRLIPLVGIGRALVGASFLAGAVDFVIAFSSSFGPATVPTLVVVQIVLGFTAPFYGVSLMSLRQAATPDHLQGRVNATYRLLVTAMLPFGALAGGFVGAAQGLRAAILIAGAGVTAASVWTIASPIVSMRDVPSESLG